METTDKVYLYGASGHAKVVMDIVQKAFIDVPCLIDDNPDVNELEGLPVVHSADDLSPIIVTIGDCQIRRRIIEKLGDREYITVVHPNAVIAESVKLGYGTVVMAGAILNPFAIIGNHCIINTGASIDHDCVIHDFVHIAPHCTLCGEAEVGEGTWVGAGTTVIQGIHIGKNCIIGAGSVVVKDIPDGCLCYGNPARIIKTFSNLAYNQQDKNICTGAGDIGGDMKRIAIFGVGGFGREVLALVKDINKVNPTWNIIGFFDDGHEKGEMVNGYPVLGKTEELNQWPSPISLAVSIGNPKVKKIIIDKINNPLVDYPTLIHPLAWVGENEYVEIGKGCIVCAGTHITTNIKIGNFVVLNLDCTVGHDTIIGNYAAFMPSVNISGEVTIGEGVYVGTGAKIINQLEIGDYTTVGAGAVVCNTLPGNCTAVGVPAKVIKVES